MATGTENAVRHAQGHRPRLLWLQVGQFSLTWSELNSALEAFIKSQGVFIISQGVLASRQGSLCELG